MRKLNWQWNRPASRTFLLGVTVAGILTTMGVFRVREQYRLFELGQELSEASKEYTELNETQRKLKLDISATKKVEDVRSVAEDNLGMKIPRERDYIVVTQ